MLQQILAGFLDKFKTQSPKTFGVISIVLIGLYASLNSGAFADVFGSPAWLNRVLEVLTFVIALLAGSHTSDILKNKDGK